MKQRLGGFKIYPGMGPSKLLETFTKEHCGELRMSNGVKGYIGTLVIIEQGYQSTAHQKTPTNAVTGDLKGILLIYQDPTAWANIFAASSLSSFALSPCGSS